MKHAFTRPSMEGYSLLLMHHVDDFPLTEHSNTASDTRLRVLFNNQTFAQESVFKCIQNFQQFAPTPMCFICVVLKNSRNAALKVNNPLTSGRCGRNFNSSDRDGIFQLLKLPKHQQAWCSRVNFITRGQFWPSGIVVGCVCLSVCAVSTCLSAR